LTYFSHQSAAERYARSRPYFHPLVIERIRSYLRLGSPLPRALDVGCGTGQSTLALKEIATEVIGTDISEEMLAEAPESMGISYVRAPAEQLPFSDASFEITTAGLTFHWFDRARFLPEANRVLRPNGWLIIYNNYFLGTMKENPDYERWARDLYLARYPTPPRADNPLTDADADTFGFRFAERETYTNEVVFSVEEHAAYLMIQTNVIAAVEQGQQSVEEVYAWLLEATRPLFPAPRGTFQFGGTVWYLQKWYN
jgi:SAM-dependent methyltransferase